MHLLYNVSIFTFQLFGKQKWSKQTETSFWMPSSQIFGFGSFVVYIKTRYRCEQYFSSN